MDTLEKLRAIFETYFQQTLPAFDDGTTPAQIKKWDSAAHLGLIMEIERQLGLEFTPRELGQLTSVGAIRALLERKRAV